MTHIIFDIKKYLIKEECMKLITHMDITSLNIPVKTCYNWVVEMIIHKKEAILPPKISMKPYDGVFCNVMPSIIKNNVHTYGGVKIVTRYPERIPSLDSKILLYDVISGEYLALLDGSWITAMRTGAVATNSIMLLAKKDYKVIGAMGLGNVARATVLTLLEMNPNRQFHFKLLTYHDQEVSFAQRFNSYSNFSYEFVDNTHDLVKGSDVILSGVTYSDRDYCNDADFDRGVLVIPIHTLGFTNCDLFFDKVFADDYRHVSHFRNFDRFRNFAEIGDIISGKVQGRENDNERILVYNIGISIHDINFASHIYEILQDKNDLIEFNMDEPTEKFWI